MVSGARVAIRKTRITLPCAHGAKVQPWAYVVGNQEVVTRTAALPPKLSRSDYRRYADLFNYVLN